MMNRNDCELCGTSYVHCVAGWKFSFMCCKDCEHKGMEEVLADRARRAADKIKP